MNVRKFLTLALAANLAVATAFDWGVWQRILVALNACILLAFVIRKAATGKD